MSNMSRSDFRFLSGQPYQVFWNRGHGGPPLNIYETETVMVIVVELAGIDPDTIQLDVEQNLVRLQGKRHINPPGSLVCIHRMEIVGGAFRFEIGFNVTVNPEQASSNYNQGLLEITLPLIKQSNQRVIVDVKEGDAQ